MANTFIETLGGIQITPAFGSGAYTISTSVDGARNESGNFVGQVVGDDKIKIECSFSMMDPIALRELLMIWDRKQGGSFVNKFLVFDPRVNDFVVKTMYVGDRSGRPYTINKTTMRPNFWVDVKANLIEV
jgi:predicted Rdx family selenoprotein